MKKIILGFLFFISHATLPSSAQNQETVGGSGSQVMTPQQGGPLRNGPGGMRPINAKTKAPQSIPSESSLEPNALIEFLQKTCPFKEARTPTNIINITKQMASSLANNNCQAIANSAKSINDSLQRNMNKLFPSKKHTEGGFDQDQMMGGMNPGMMNMGMNQDSDICDTYQLKASLDREDAYKIGAMDKSMLPMNYQQCGMNPNFDECVENVYQASLIQGASKCTYNESNSKRNDKNQAIKSSIEDITKSLQDVIQNSEGCPQETKQSVINNSLGIMSNLSSVAVSSGLLGVGISMTSSIISSVASVLSRDKSPDKIINEIQKEDNANDISCLGYMLSRSAFSCDKKLLGNSKTLQQPQLLNQQDPAALKLIGNIKDIGNKILDTKSVYDKNGYKKNENNKDMDPSDLGEINDGLLELINSKIQDPENENKEITVGEFLDKVADSLQKDKSSYSKIRSSKIKKFISLANDFDSYKNKSGKTDIEDQIKYNKQLSDSALDLFSPTKDGSGFLDDMYAYGKRTESKQAQGFFEKMKNVELATKEKAIGRGVAFEIADNVNSQYQRGIEGRTVRIAYRAFLSSFKSSYDSRLKTLNNDLLGDIGRVDKETLFDSIANVARMCAVGSAPILVDSPSSSRLSQDVLKKTPDIYRSACERFDCLVPTYKPDENQSDDERSVKFSEYQCNNYYKFPVAMKRFENEFSSKGTICGKPLR